MKLTFYFFLFFTTSICCQETIETSLLSKTELNADVFIGVDNFDYLYSIKNNIFRLHKKHKTIEYSNLQLGELSTVNVFNPLKTNLFYKDFNSVIILDNRLAEVFKLDFNTINPYKNITHVSTGNDNTIWVFNQNTQQLELYDYKSNIKRAETSPIQNPVLNLKSNYNFCWLLTKNYIYKYNYFGSLILKIPNNGFTDFAETNGNIILKKNNTLFYLKKNTEFLIPITIPNLLINQFFVTGETLYIYADKTLLQFQLKI